MSTALLLLAAAMIGGSLGAIGMGILAGARQAAHDLDARRMEALRAHHVTIWATDGQIPVHRYADRLLEGDDK
jgi:hypothetical protein